MKCSFGQRVRLLLLHTIEVAYCFDVMLRSVRNRHFLKIVIELLGEEAGNSCNSEFSSMFISCPFAQMHYKKGTPL